LIVIGAAGLVAPVLFLLLREPVRKEHRAVGLPLKTFVALFLADYRRLVPLYAGIGLVTIGDYALWSWFPSRLSRKFLYAPAGLGVWIASVASVGNIVGCVAGGTLADWAWRRGGVGAIATVGSVGVGMGALGTILVSASDVWLALAGLGTWSIASGIAFTCAFVALQDIMPGGQRGIGTALVAFCTTVLGLGLGPTMVALVTERIFAEPQSVGFAMSIVVCPAAAVACALFLTVRSAADRLGAHQPGNLGIPP